MEVTWDDGTVEDVELGDANPSNSSASLEVIWDDGTEETINIDSPTRTGEGTTESPYKLSGPLDRRITGADEVRDSTADVSQTTAEVQQAVSTLADQMGVSKGSDKNMAKFNKEITRILKEKGYQVQNRGGKLVAINEFGDEIPVESGFMDSLRASGVEALGGIGAGIGSGALAGSVAGPVGGLVGGLVGGALGATAGDQADVSRNAEKYGIEVTDDERVGRAIDVGLTDLGLGLVGGAVAKGLGKILSDDAAKAFTKLADMPSRERKAIKTLQKETGLSDEAMEEAIRRYAATADEPISNLKAVEGAARASESDQLEFAKKAMSQSTDAKVKGLEEIMSRADQIVKAGAGDDEVSALISKNMLDDKGRRKAIDWVGLKEDLGNVGLKEGDALYDRVSHYADTFGDSDVSLFKSAVGKVDIPDEVPAIPGLTDTARGSLQSNVGAAQASWFNRTLNNIAAELGFNPKQKTVNIIEKAMKQGGYTPKKLEQELVDSGLSKLEAKRAAEIALKEMDQVAKEEARRAKETEAKLKSKRALFDKAVKEDSKAIEAGVNRETKEFNAAKNKVVKEAQSKYKEALRRQEKDWDLENAELLDSLSKTEKAKLKELRRRALVDAKYGETTPSDKALEEFKKSITGKDRVIEAGTNRPVKKSTPAQQPVKNSTPTKSPEEIAEAKRKAELNKELNRANLEQAVSKAGLEEERKAYKEGGKIGKESFGDYLIRIKADKKKVEEYLKNHPDPTSKVNQKLKRYVEGSESPLMPKVRLTLKEKKEALGDEAFKVYEVWAEGVKSRSKKTNPDISIGKFLRSSAGKPFRKETK